VSSGKENGSGALTADQYESCLVQLKEEKSTLLFFVEPNTQTGSLRSRVLSFERNIVIKKAK